MMIRIDGDFPVEGSKCEYLCSPTCHPAQICDEWQYGCTHIAWPQNQERDFCPIVKCGGNTKNCEIPRYMLTKSEEVNLGLA